MEARRTLTLEMTAAQPDRYTILPFRGCTGRNVPTILLPSPNCRLENAASCQERDRRGVGHRERERESHEECVYS